MKTRNFLWIMACTFLLPLEVAWAADQMPLPNQLPAPTQERIRAQDRDQLQANGSQLMTDQEREEYRNRMRAAKSVEEQEQIRKEHHELMQERAKARGLSLPDLPPPRQGGMGMGNGGMGGGGPGGSRR